MNDEDIRTVLRSAPADVDPLDPGKVIAGARRRRRNRGIAAGVVASAAVVAVAAVGVIGETRAGQSPADPPVASTTPSPATATARQPAKDRYVFQNQEPPVGTVPRDGEVRIADHVYFATRGTQWAVISRLPGEPQYEPFGWRKTADSGNFGEKGETAPGLHSTGQLYTSVFRSEDAATVVYTQGAKAWYGKLNRLAGIPGWVQSSAMLTGMREPTVTPGPATDVSVFVFDRTGRLLTRFGDGDIPSPR